MDGSLTRQTTARRQGRAAHDRLPIFHRIGTESMERANTSASSEAYAVPMGTVEVEDVGSCLDFSIALVGLVEFRHCARI